MRLACFISTIRNIPCSFFCYYFKNLKKNKFKHNITLFFFTFRY